MRLLLAYEIADFYLSLIGNFLLLNCKLQCSFSRDYNSINLITESKFDTFYNLFIQSVIWKQSALAQIFVAQQRPKY